MPKKGYKQTEEHIKKRMEETRMKLIGRKHSVEHRKRISEALKGKTHGFKKGVSSWNKGIPMSKKTKEKLSKQLKGRLSHKKGRTLEDLYGSKRAKEMITKNRIHKLKNPTRYWLGKERDKNTIDKLKKFWNSEEGKRILKDKRAEQIFPVKDTSIEVKIQNFLKQLGIEFFTHQYMKIEHSYQCDILIPSMNLVIECDGDYWHKYPIGKDIDLYCNISDTSYISNRDERRCEKG